MTQKDYDKLMDFIMTAHLATYANETAKPTLASFKEEVFSYTDKTKGLFYQDKYVAEHNFMGYEVVYHMEKVHKDLGSVNFKPIWSMMYHGKVLSKTIEKKVIFNFLKQALRDVPNDLRVLPVRGPRKFTVGDFSYINQREDQGVNPLSSFMGGEQILFKNELVYSCLYSGGTLFR